MNTELLTTLLAYKFLPGLAFIAIVFSLMVSLVLYDKFKMWKLKNKNK